MSRRFAEEALRLREQLEGSARSAADVERGSRRLQAGRERKPRRAWLLIPAVAILLALFFMRPKEGDLEITAGGECVVRSDDAIAAGPCGVELSVGSEARGFAFTGRARFSVAKRGKKRLEIAVSHGRIVVIGTRFVVEQRERSGRVDVEEGTVEFRWSDGSPSDRLNAGASLEWPRAVKTAPIGEPSLAPPPPPREKRKPPPREKKISSKELMQRLFQLKSQRRYDEAIELLSEGTKRRDFSEVQRERLSYELGNLIRQAGRPEEACRHLREHLRLFPSTPRRREIADTCP